MDHLVLLLSESTYFSLVHSSHSNDGGICIEWNVGNFKPAIAIISNGVIQANLPTHKLTFYLKAVQHADSSRSKLIESIHKINLLNDKTGVVTWNKWKYLVCGGNNHQRTIFERGEIDKQTKILSQKWFAAMFKDLKSQPSVGWIYPSLKTSRLCGHSIHCQAEFAHWKKARQRCQKIADHIIFNIFVENFNIYYSNILIHQ